MHVALPLRSLFPAVAAALVCAVVAPAAARADMTVVQKITTTGLPREASEAQGGQRGAPDPSKPQTLKTLFKGDRVRTESNDAVTIFDGAAEQVYVLNPQTKRYTVLSAKQMFDEGAGGNSMLAMLQFDTVADLKETPDTKQLSGKAARRYTYTATMKPAGKGEAAGLSSILPTVTLEGEQWVAGDIATPPAYRRLAALAGFGPLSRLMGKGAAPLIDKMAALPGLPLAARETVTLKFSDPSGPFAQNAPKEPIVTQREVVSLSDKDLDAALFQVPADYVKVEAPGAPAEPAAPATKP